MRVLHVSTGRAWRGGEQQVLYLMEGLARLGVTQELICPRGTAFARRLASTGLPVRAIPIWNEADLGAVGRIAQRARRGRFDLLHLHTSQAHGLGALAARLLGKRRPRVVVTRRVQHSIFRHSFLRLDRLKYHPGADRVLCVSTRIERVLLEDGLPPSLLAVVPDGIDVERFGAPVPAHAARETRRAWGIPDGAPVVGQVGHLDETKGAGHLLAALPRVQASHLDARLVLVGEGPEHSVLETEALRLEVADRVVFAGFRPDVPEVLAALDVFCFPSTEEGLGTSLLEAMAAQKPIVAARAGGIPEAVRDLEEGLLVAPADPEALATGIARLLEDADLAMRLSTAAQARARAEFGAERMVATTVMEYERVLAYGARSLRARP